MWHTIKNAKEETSYQAGYHQKDPHTAKNPDILNRSCLRRSDFTVDLVDRLSIRLTNYHRYHLAPPINGPLRGKTHIDVLKNHQLVPEVTIPLNPGISVHR
jgi:hypothetical protein